jgi:N-acyl-D-aspartate/D-glutamate deacylase
MTEASKRSGMPVTFALLQSPLDNEGWRDQLARTEAANAEGARVTAQVAIRGTGILMNWRGTVNPFGTRASWKAIADKPWDEQLRALKDPAFKARLLSDPVERPDIDIAALADIIFYGWAMQYPLGDSPDYEPSREDSIAARAAREGRDPAEYAYDVMLADEGRGFIYLPLLNYAEGHLDHVAELLRHPNTVVSLSDGGAHCGTICDAASPTFMLTHWARDRARGRLTLEEAVHRQTAHTASVYGLSDRGIIAPGYLGDLNVIDHAALRLEKPYLAFDLPAGGKRLLQRAQGYRATVKAGAITFRDGVATGARPGRVLRGPQRSPMALAAE